MKMTVIKKRKTISMRKQDDCYYFLKSLSHLSRVPLTPKFFCSWLFWRKSIIVIHYFLCFSSSAREVIFAQGHWETKERKKRLSRICPKGVLLLTDIFADLNDFCAGRSNWRDFKARKFRWIPVHRMSISKVKQLASPADVTNTSGFRPPFTQPWTEASQLQTFVDFQRFDGFS